MIFQVACRMTYEVDFPSTLVLSVHAHQGGSQKVLEENFCTDLPMLRSETIPSATGDRFQRLETGSCTGFTVMYSAQVDCDVEILRNQGVSHTPVANLDTEALGYLFPSRYCESDRLGKLAWDLFGRYAQPQDRVVAICDWIHSNVGYVPGSTDASTSACQTIVQRAGVCRDFAHLGIALCRALNIPARYITGYAYQLEPPDFHACFECLIGGRWCIYDATRLAHPNGLVRIATGRDASETAVASIFGSARSSGFQVSCVPAPGQQFVPLPPGALWTSGVSQPAGI
jgi:transglutaminase-like putative cysteine protease